MGLISLIFSSCLDENEQSFSGVVFDSITQKPIKGIEVKLSGEETHIYETDEDGIYKFKGLKTGNYILSFTKPGYSYFETEITAGMGRMGNYSYNAVLESTGSQAYVTVNECLALSDGLYYDFLLSSDTKEYYWDCWSTSELPSKEADIISGLLSDGIHSTTEHTGGYYYDLEERTNYTLCIIAFDAQGRRGALYKTQHSTKSSANQPEAKINIRSINNGIATYDITRNSYCDKYILNRWYNLTEENLQSPDVLWAGRAYFTQDRDESIVSQNYTSATWNQPSNLCLLVTLGYDRNGNVSAVINKQAFSTVTNSLRSSSPTLKNGTGSNKSRGRVERDKLPIMNK